VSDDQALRAALILIALVVLPIGLYYRVRSQATRETLDRRQEGLFILATLRPAGLVMATGVIAFLIDPSSMDWSSLRLPILLRWGGVSLCALGGALLIWTFRQLGPNLTDTVVTRQQHTLVTDGPYRWVRHPFYGAVALFILGIALSTANWFVLACGALVLGLLVIRTRTEEEKLLARFGDSYRAYMKRTGRFVPK
jgi:protein-S-isoprenylcysteine O-methyltransferase Ste14